MTTVRLESNIPELLRLLDEARAAGRTIGFVPTMGYLHRGHESLVEASARDGHFTVATVFINPAQFGPNEDLDAYPQDPDGDFEACSRAGADLVWYPTRPDLYPETAQTSVMPGALADCLCGVSRPVFFGGICTVVLKFFNLIRPHVAYFGEKDFQQLSIIRRMVEDFYLNIRIVGGATVREPDGLAMSSRNARLKPHQRDTALTLWRTICAAREAYAAGERDALSLREMLLAAWPDELTFDYLDFREPRDLELVEDLDDDVRIFLGCWLDGVRLIDNASLT